ncbi:MAG TPA: hypothetical protein P5572_02655, partial [Phycisphaerae bacterium]|nr:hypothetical protein [Phycisphaerae bacterium]
PFDNPALDKALLIEAASASERAEVQANGQARMGQRSPMRCLGIAPMGRDMKKPQSEALGYMR